MAPSTRPSHPSGTDRTGAGSRPIAWVDGRVLPASEATVPLADDGFLRGDAVFERVLVRAGRTHALEAHLDRMRRSAQTLGIRLPVLRQVVTDLLLAWGERDGAVRLVVTRDGTVRGMMETSVWPDSVALATVQIPWRTAISGTTTVSYAVNQWARRQAKELDADDAIIVEDGYVLELPAAALCLVHGDRITTADHERLPVLDSITVRALAEVVEVERTEPTLDDLRRADELFVLSATCPVMAVHSVVLDGEVRSYDAPGSVTADARSRLEEHIEETLDPLPG